MDIASPSSEQARADYLRASLTNHPPVDRRIVERFELIREDAKQLGETILRHAPNSRERSLAVTHLEDAVMWAIKAVAMHQAALLNAEGLHAGCVEIPATDFSDRAWEIQSDCSLPHPAG